MNRIIITETKVSNKPVEIITLKTDPQVIEEWVRILIENPDRYTVEISQKFDFEKKFSMTLEAMTDLKMFPYLQDAENRNSESMMFTLCAAFNGFSYSQESGE